MSKKKFIVIWLVCVVALGVFNLVLNYLEVWRYNAQFTEVGICLTKGHYEFATTIPISASEIYVCGVVAGKTARPADLHVAYENHGTYYSVAVEPLPGQFFLPIKPPQDGYRPGHYYVEMVFLRKPIAQTKFIISEPLP